MRLNGTRNTINIQLTWAWARVERDEVPYCLILRINDVEVTTSWSRVLKLCVRQHQGRVGGISGWPRGGFPPPASRYFWCVLSANDETPSSTATDTCSLPVVLCWYIL